MFLFSVSLFLMFFFSNFFSNCFLLSIRFNFYNFFNFHISQYIPERFTQYFHIIFIFVFIIKVFNRINIIDQFNNNNDFFIGIFSFFNIFALILLLLWITQSQVHYKLLYYSLSIEFNQKCK